MVKLAFAILAFALLQSGISNPLPQTPDTPTGVAPQLPGLDELQGVPGLSTLNDLPGGILKRGLPLPGLGILNGIAGSDDASGDIAEGLPGGLL